MGRGGDQVRLVYGQFDSSSILPCVSGHVVLRFAGNDERVLGGGGRVDIKVNVAFGQSKLAAGGC